jgi:hypothetical protein
MKASFATSFVIVAVFVAGSSLPGFAQDTTTQPAPAAQTPPPAASTETVPRPSIVPKSAAPAAPAADNNPPAPRHRRYAHRYHRYGYYRTAYWEPFPVYWPHLYHNRIHWNRIPWFVRF